MYYCEGKAWIGWSPIVYVYLARCKCNTEPCNAGIIGLDYRLDSGTFGSERGRSMQSAARAPSAVPPNTTFCQRSCRFAQPQPQLPQQPHVKLVPAISESVIRPKLSRRP